MTDEEVRADFENHLLGLIQPGDTVRAQLVGYIGYERVGFMDLMVDPATITNKIHLRWRRLIAGQPFAAESVVELALLRDSTLSIPQLAEFFVGTWNRQCDDALQEAGGSLHH